jgi:hypothetical protein
MRRAIPGLLAALLALAAAPSLVRAQGGSVAAVNGIGLIDYGSRPKFEVGQFVRYHVTGESQTGYTDDYVVTVGIVGEERFWGEDCFWVETVTEHSDPSKPGTMLATLMSYAVFDDRDALRNMQLYMRKSIAEIDEQGRPVQQIMKRPPGTLKARDRAMTTLRMAFDTLGTDTVIVPAGSFDTRIVRIQQGSSNRADHGDSTQYTELRETRLTHLSSKVPVTGLVREDIDYVLKRRTWLIGRSQTGEMNTLEHSKGRANLIEFGSGRKSQLLTEAMQKSLEQQQAESTARARPKAASSGGARR